MVERCCVRAVVLITCVFLATQVQISEGKSILHRLWDWLSEKLQQLISSKDEESGYPNDFIFSDIGCDWVYLTWESLNITYGLSQWEYNVTCSNKSTSISVTTEKTTYNITNLLSNANYSCTVIAFLEKEASSLPHPTISFVPGIGTVVDVPNNHVIIANFTDELKDTVLNCTVRNGVQTDTVWSPDVVKSHISGDGHRVSAACDSTYGNHMNVSAESMKKLNGVNVSCGSHVEPYQATFEFHICDLPQQNISDEVHLWENTENCKLENIIDSYIEAENVTWKKDGSELRYGISHEMIIFDEIRREDSGLYVLTFDARCHSNSSSRSFVFSFSLDVTYGPEMIEGPRKYSVLKGNPSKLICGEKLRGNPKPIVTWINPNNEFISNEKQYIMSNTPDATLTINNATERDNGAWSCTVKVDSPSAVEICPDPHESKRQLQFNDLMLIVVVPPSEPQDFIVLEVNTPTIHFSWNKPVYLGSPFLAGYQLCYADHCLDVIREESIKVDIADLKKESCHHMTARAISKSDNVIGESIHSNSVMLVTDYPNNFMFSDIGCDWVYLTWESLNITCGLSQWEYNVTCSNESTSIGVTTEKTTCNITNLLSNANYSCTVIAFLEKEASSLPHPTISFVPGIGTVVDVPNNHVIIANFTDELKDTVLNCTVRNGVQTDTVWSPDVVKSHISGDGHRVSAACDSTYGNHMNVSAESMRKLNGVNVSCGSHVEPYQATFEFHICDLPQKNISDEVHLWENTESCKLENIIDSHIEADNVTWKKDGSELRNGISHKMIIFDEIRREDSGLYVLTFDARCHSNSSSRSFVFSFSLDVTYGPEMIEGPRKYSVLKGNPSKLICGEKLRGNPKPIVTWINPNNEFISNEKQYIMSNTPDATLTINNATDRDNGAWSCTVKVDSPSAVEICPDPHESKRQLQLNILLIVVVPPSEPQDFIVLEVNTPTKIHFSWDKPVYLGSPFLAGYQLCHADHCLDVIREESIKVDIADLKKESCHHMTARAISKSDNVIGESIHSNSVMLVTGYPNNFIFSDIGCDWVYLTWESLNITCGLSQWEYNVTCSNESTSISVTTEKTTYNITNLLSNANYSCTVIAFLEKEASSLPHPTISFVPGIGTVVDVPNNHVIIANFTDELKDTVLNCTVRNGVQTDTMWSPDVVKSHISGDGHRVSAACDSTYGNHMNVSAESMKKLNGVNVSCGSHVEPYQATFEFHICDLPQKNISDEVHLWEKTENCKLENIIDFHIEAENVTWKKDGSELRYGISHEMIIFDEIRREDSGIYVLTFDARCHSNSSSRSFVFSFSLDVTYGPEMIEGPRKYSVLKGNPSKLICGEKLRGNPKPIVTWINPNNEFISNEKQYIMSNTPDATLTINDATERDNGTWSCTVKVDSPSAVEICPDPHESKRQLQFNILLIVVVPPSVPQNVHVNEDKTSTIYFSWDEPSYFGSPYFDSYKLCLNSTCHFTTSQYYIISRLERDKVYIFTIYAISKSGNVSAQSLPSEAVCFANASPHSFAYNNSDSRWVIVHWEAPTVLCQHSEYRITCNGTSDVITSTTNFTFISLFSSTKYICTVVAVCGTGICSQRSDELSFYTQSTKSEHESKYNIIVSVVAVVLAVVPVMYFTCTRLTPKIGQPGKPKASKITHDSVELTWTSPTSNASKCTSYAVLFRANQDPPGQWNRHDTNKTTTVVKGLSPMTKYAFKLCTLCEESMGPESQVSDTVTTTAVPSRPYVALTKPYATHIAHNSVTVAWDDEDSDVLDYIVLYRSLDSSSWKKFSLRTQSRSAIIGGLRSQTKYVFQIRTVSGVTSSISNPVMTKADTSNEVIKESIAKSLKEHSVKIFPGEPSIYYPRVKTVSGQITRCIISASESDFMSPVDEKVLMLVGATGAGKSTLINGIVNYIMGVQWEDEFRFKVVNEEKTSQAFSQTSRITAYSIYHSTLPYTLTVIDTPGFGDTTGVASDKSIVNQIQSFFSVRSPDSINQIHGIGFVIQAPQPRLTATMKYTFDSVLSIFGKDVASNIFLLLTFADGTEPTVLSAIKDAVIPYQKDFHFNNSAIYAKQKGHNAVAKMFWNLGYESFESFFAEFEKVEPHSLQLTRENLHEREHLEAVVKGLKLQIQVGMTKIDMLRQKQDILRHREVDIIQNKYFEYELTVTKQRQVDLPNNVSVTNCTTCSFTCHFPCPIAEDKEKYRCKAMNSGGQESAHCTVCPGNCPWSQHVNASQRFELYYMVEVHTSDELKEKFSRAVEGKNEIEAIISDIEKELDMLQGVIIGLVREAKRSLERLHEVALKPNPLSEIEYIDLLIKDEQSEKSPGFKQRIKTFEIIKTMVHNLKDGKKVDNMWWKNVIDPEVYY